MSPVELGLVVPEGMIDRVILRFSIKVFERLVVCFGVEISPLLVFGGWCLEMKVIERLSPQWL